MKKNEVIKLTTLIVLFGLCTSMQGSLEEDSELVMARCSKPKAESQETQEMNFDQDTNLDQGQPGCNDMQSDTEEQASNQNPKDILSGAFEGDLCGISEDALEVENAE